MEALSGAKTVLIVEDDLQTREMYRLALQNEGFKVVAVEDGLDALKHIEANRPDAVVLDLMLPRVGGYDVYRDLRSNPDTAEIPVVIVTGAEVRDLEPTEFRFFIRKPITPDALVGVVYYALSPQHRFTTTSQ